MLANLVLHHFPAPQLGTVFRQCAKHCRAFLAIEPRRSPVTFAASRSIGLLGCNAVSRHHGPISVRAGFAGRDLSGLWPADPHWHLVEKPVHLITHIFAARRIG